MTGVRYMLPWQRYLCLALFLLTNAACGSTGMVSTTARPPESGRGYFIIGIQPAQARVTVFRGWKRDGYFRQDDFAIATIQSNPEDGFIMGETNGDTDLGIVMVSLTSSSTSIFGPSFAPSGCAKTMVFTVPSGKVVYIGSVTYAARGNALFPSFRKDVQGARDFVTKHYPQLADRLEEGSYQLMPAGPWCNNPT